MCIWATLGVVLLSAHVAYAIESSASATSQATQRYFLDSNSGLHWRFSARDGALVYAMSTDGVRWTSAGTLPYASPFFSLTFKSLGGQSFVVVAAENEQGSVVIRRGWLFGRNIEFDNEVVVFEREAGAYRYTKPALTISADGAVWVACVRVRMWLGERYQVMSSRTVGTLAQQPALQFTERLSVGRPATAVSSIAMVPIASQEILIALSGESNSNVMAYRYHEGSWQEASAGGDFSGLAFAGADLNGPVRALVLDTNGALFAGGAFSTADGMPADNIAMWNGTRWAPLGPGLNGTVLALASDADGNIYAGGEFTKAGGVSVHYVARWNGVDWHALSGGANGVVRALKVDSLGAVVAAGDFTRVGEIPANRIARWSGSAWTALGEGLSADGAMATVHGLAVFERNIFATGVFTTAGGVRTQGIARWDGSRWNACGSGIAGIGSALATTSRGEVYVAGNFTSAGEVSARNIARWDGSRWAAVGQGLVGSVAPGGLAIDAQNRPYVVGTFQIAGDGGDQYALRWDGATWAPLRTGVPTGQLIGGLNGPAYALAISLDGSILMGGEFDTAGGSNVGHVVRFDPSVDNTGTQDSGVGVWSALSRMGLNGAVYAAAMSPLGELFVGGTFTRIGGISANRVARWSGERWHQVGNGFNGPVRALGFDGAGTLYAGGDFSKTGVVSTPHVAAFAEGAWRGLARGTNGPVYAIVAVSDGELYVGGEFSEASGTVVHNIAVWREAQWAPLDRGLDGAVRTVVRGPQGGVFVGGDFLHAGDIRVNHVAMWDQSRWLPLGDGASAPVRSAVVNVDGALIAGGDFVFMSGQRVNYIATWDGSSWGSLGTGVEAPIGRIAVDSQGAVYVTTTRGQADGRAVANLWRWDRAWVHRGSLPMGSVSALLVGRDSKGIERIYAGERTALLQLGDVAGANQLPASSVSLVTSASGDVQMFYIGAGGTAFARTFSASGKAWGVPIAVHRGAVTFLAAQIDPISGRITVWLRDGADVRSGVSESPDSSFTVGPPLTGSQLQTLGAQLLDDASGRAALVDWEAARSDDEVQIIGPPETMPTLTPTPTATETPAPLLAINLQVRRGDGSAFAGAPIPGLGVQVEEIVLGVTRRTLNGITSTDGHLKAPISVRADADLVIRPRDPSLARFEVSGPAAEFSVDQEFVIDAQVMIEPTGVCAKRAGSSVEMVFGYRNHNADQQATYVPVTGLSQSLLGEPFDRADDLLLNSLDYSGGGRIIPLRDTVIEVGQELRQWFAVGEGTVSVHYDSSFGELTWAILGASLSAHEATEMCPQPPDPAACRPIDRARLGELVVQVSSTGRFLERRFAKSDRRLRARFRSATTRAVKLISAAVTELNAAVDCSAISQVPPSCQQLQAPSERITTAYDRVFRVQIRGSANARFQKYRRTASANYRALVQAVIPPLVASCGGV